MPKPIGPTIPRWQLGEQLARLRDSAGISQAQIADRLGCSVSKVQKIEAGDVGIVRAELLLMLDVYGVSDAEVRDSLLELQRLGKQRGWWKTFGQVPAPFATFLGMESAATRIQVFEPMVIYGLLQTEDYARAIAETCELGLTEEQVERQVKLRMERQQRVLEEDSPELWVILDEAVLYREVGGKAVMAAQLKRLVAMAREMTLQVVPLSHGGYPGVRGSLTIFDFDERMHSPVAYVEGQAGNLYMEKADDLRRCSVVYNHMRATALSKQESVKLIAAVARQYAEADGAHREPRSVPHRVAKEHAVDE
ncbi:helix-turn-helix domain-containing protein [Planosporangium flavigriseum]|uniref:Transcriptional regulator n=1 Tax=Planosporangium flavigriseum TaxID=373681 RepID=A0A8J3LHT5_9ACTN|nr:helix-turn-helix transcriptional regulator [Planosporangium flavigriseum]NJC62925.1 helix-turn-helix domain-containing protein [Planosporangium flavigriseum]GIG73212.1 transcriptional regulator [Planosporangium flavigriseum]